jgi:hypothetical protein
MEARQHVLGARIGFPAPREAVMLTRVAWIARTAPRDGLLVHMACEGVVVHRDDLVMWGITPEAEDALRALASNPGVDPSGIDAGHLLAVVLGAPQAPVALSTA